MRFFYKAVFFQYFSRCMVVWVDNAFNRMQFHIIKSIFYNAFNGFRYNALAMIIGEKHVADF